MSKEKDKRKNLDIFDKKDGRDDIVRQVTNSLTKHGKIKCKDAKKEKNLKNACMHHLYTKKGKLRAAIEKTGDTCTCTACNHSFNTYLCQKKEVKEILEPTWALIDQAKYLSTAARLGKNAEKYLARLSIDLGNFPKTYEKITKIVSEKEKSKSKKKKGKNKKGFSGGSSSQLGSWSTN